MPKMKTNRAANKRLRKNSTGKIKRARAYRRHILTKKSPGRKRKLRKTAYVSRNDEREALRLLPN